MSSAARFVTQDLIALAAASSHPLSPLHLFAPSLQSCRTTPWIYLHHPRTESSPFSRCSIFRDAQLEAAAVLRQRCSGYSTHDGGVGAQVCEIYRDSEISGNGDFTWK